jgi:hypothetical protein
MTEDRAINARLSRIESSLDKLAEAFVSLARVETRMEATDKRMDALAIQQGKDTSRIGAMENTVGSNGQSLRFAERLFWIIASASVAYFFAGAFA